MRTLGIILIVAGILAFALPYFTFTTKEKALDLGPLEVVTEKKENVPVSPIVGGVLLLAGAGIVIASAVGKKA